MYKEQIKLLTDLLDAQIVKPEYHNLVAGLIQELKTKERTQQHCQCGAFVGGTK